jgi:pilus assembly protein CpaC
MPTLRKLKFALGAAMPALLAVLLFARPAHAQPQALPQDIPNNALPFSVTATSSRLFLTEKETRVLQTKARIKRVWGFDPAVLKIVSTSDATRVHVIALAQGITNVYLIDETETSFALEVLVSGDVRQLQAAIRHAIPSSSVQALKVKDSVLLTGWVDQPQQATEVVELAEQFHPKVLNYLQVSGVQQVLLRVKMMEAQRSKIRSMGFNFLQLREHSYAGSLVGGLTPLANQTPSTNLANPFGGFVGPVTSAVNPASATAIFGLVAMDNAFQGFIEALKQEALLTILAEPNLIAVNGRPASFLSGGQFPVPIPQGLGTVSIQYKNFGVQLEFVPTVLGNGRLRMDVRPEVSEKDLSNTVVVQGITVPSLTTRRVETQVEMNFGETLVIAGLISNRVQARSQKIPFFGELPWVGAAFRRVSHDEAETELLVMVTPELASPLDESQLPQGGPGRNTVSPTDRELYFNGYMEVPRYAPDPDAGIGDSAQGYYAPPAKSGYVSPPEPSAPANVAPVSGGSPRAPTQQLPAESYFERPLDALPAERGGSVSVDSIPAPPAAQSGSSDMSRNARSRGVSPAASKVLGNTSAVRTAEARRNGIIPLKPSRSEIRPDPIEPTWGSARAPSSRDSSRPGLIKP